MSCREDKLQELRRQRQEKDSEEGEEQELTDETSTFIEVSSNDLSKTPEKGILKHQEKEKWSDEASQSDNQEVTSHLVNNIDSSEDGLTEVERTLKTLNGYHEEILEALHSASSYRSGDSESTTPQEEQKSFSSAVKSESPKGNEDEDTVQSSGPIRIRNLEDLLCQLEQHPDQHISPTLSEEIRLSVPEADRQYLLERKDISDMAKHHLETGLGYLLGHIQPPSVNTKSPRYSRHVTAEEEEADESADDDEGSTFSSHHLVRSASEEALPVTGKPYERKIKKHEQEEAIKQDGRDYFPSPPSEDSYANSSEENAFVPPPSSTLASTRGERMQKSQATPPTPAQSTAHPPGVKRKTKKKFPEYKV